ncbi:MAG: hypothetical protein QOK68_08170 [Nitrososphaeraceae archaeon]|nr:hypothetical protein [Nitrososphaeraceae archaeon]
MAYSPVSDEIYDRMKSQARFTLQAIIMPFCISILLFYIVAYFHSDIFSLLNGLPGVVILSGSVIVVMKLLFYTKLERSELHKFSSLLLGIFCLLIGETLYFHQQYFLQISIPYPSVADVPYLLASLFFSYFLFLCIFSLINRKGLNPLPIILVSSLAIFPIYLILSSAYNFGINESSELEFIVNSLYYAFDALMLVPALVILLYLKKKDPFIFHWIFITVALILLVIGDVGYTYFSIISESLLQEFEWLWSIIYALGYLFLGIGIYWYDRIKNTLQDKKINLFLEKDEMDRLKNSSKNELIGDTRSEYFEHIIGFENFVDKLEDFLERSKQIKILFYDKYWLSDEKVSVILDEIQQRANVTQIQVNILVPISQISFKSFVSYTNNKNILVSFFDRTFSSDSLVFIFEEKYVAILDKKPASEFVDNNTVFYGLITNKDTIVWSHITTFEKIWLLEKAVNM